MRKKKKTSVEPDKRQRIDEDRLPVVRARIVKKGKFKLIDAPLPEISVAEAVKRSQHRLLD